MDETRRDLACQVSENLKSQDLISPFFQDLLVFDNTSKFGDHLRLFPPSVKAVRSDKNIGYWSAIYWALFNYEKVFNRKYKYLYIIESDLEHWDMFKLDLCEKFLDDHQKVGGVRTQEFSVRFRIFYDKQYHWLPFARRRSLVSQKNAITKEQVWFQKDNPNSVLWITNFHTKLPALNRLDALKVVFEELATKKKIDEIYFMHLYHKLYSTMAVLNGGIYRNLSHTDTDHVSGSYSTSAQLNKLGYQNTRTDFIRKEGFCVDKICGAE